jgi:hypothetical protein
MLIPILEPIAIPNPATFASTPPGPTLNPVSTAIPTFAFIPFANVASAI